MTPKLKIRWMLGSDLYPVTVIARACFDGDNLDTITENLKEKSTIAMVADIAADHESVVVGYMIYRLHDRHIDLQRLAVDPNCRREGIGRAMLGKLIGKLDGQRLAVDLVVPDDQLGAHLFLRACGFRATLVSRSHYGPGRDGYRFSHITTVPAPGPDPLYSTPSILRWRKRGGGA